jgi:hypothetical protein
MDAVRLTHVQLSKVEPGSLVLTESGGAEAEQYFAIAVRDTLAVRLVSFRADRGALRAVRTDFSTGQAPERFVLSFGRHFTVEPNLFEQVRTDFLERSTLRVGDLLVREAQQFLVVAPAQDTPLLVLDLAAGEVTELPPASVAVVTHWNIYVRNAEGQRICVVDTKSHRQATARPTSGSAVRARR